MDIAMPAPGPAAPRAIPDLRPAADAAATARAAAPPPAAPLPAALPPGRAALPPVSPTQIALLGRSLLDGGGPATGRIGAAAVEPPARVLKPFGVGMLPARPEGEERAAAGAAADLGPDEAAGPGEGPAPPASDAEPAPRGSRGSGVP